MRNIVCNLDHLDDDCPWLRIIVDGLHFKASKTFQKGFDMKRFLAVMALVCSMSILAGCDGNAPPTKPGGGGLPQPYSPDNGQYIPGK